MSVKLDAGRVMYAAEKAKAKGLEDVTVKELLHPYCGDHAMRAWEVLAFALGDGEVYESEKDRTYRKLYESFGIKAD